MSKRCDAEFLADIVEAITRIAEYTHDIDYNGFLQNEMAQDAVVRNLQVIGEAAKNISSDFKKKHKDVEWKKMAGLRDKIIHHYFGINWDIVWDTAKNKLPELRIKFKNIRQ